MITILTLYLDDTFKLEGTGRFDGTIKSNASIHRTEDAKAKELNFLPPIHNKDFFSRDDSSKATGFFDEIREFRKRKDSVPNESDSMYREPLAMNTVKPMNLSDREERKGYFGSEQMFDEYSIKDDNSLDGVPISKKKIISKHPSKVVSDISGKHILYLLSIFSFISIT